MAIIQLRKPAASEADDLTELALTSKAYWDYDDEFIYACRDELTQTPEQINSSNFVYEVAELNGKLAGFYKLDVSGNLDLDLAGDLELDCLYVLPFAIGQGVGKSLFSAMINRANSLDAKTISIQADPNAEAFYQHLGAKTVGQRESGSIPGRFLPLMQIDLV